MSENDGADKTEDATPQKREKARKEGQVATSAELGVAVTMLVLTITIAWILPSSAPEILENFRNGLVASGERALDAESAVLVLREMGLMIARTVAPVALLALVAGTAASLVQVGFHPNFDLLAPKWNRLDPANWIKRISSIELPVGILKAMFKGLGVVAIAAFALRNEPDDLWRLALVESGSMVEHLREVASSVVVRVTAALVVVATLDFAFARYRFEQKLKMSKQELKDEAKEADGNPHVKAAMRRRMREKSQRPLADRMKEATVVTVNPTHYAVALRYWPDVDRSPKVIAKGTDFRAQKIRELAREHGVPIIEDKPLTRALYANAKEGRPIPEELFLGVARLIKIVWQADPTKRN